MANYKIEYSRLANDQLINILNYLNKNWGVKTADDFEVKFLKKIGHLIINPNLGRPAFKKSSVRCINLTKHNKLYYSIRKETIFLISIFDNRQNPSKNKFD